MVINLKIEDILVAVVKETINQISAAVKKPTRIEARELSAVVKDINSDERI